MKRFLSRSFLVVLLCSRAFVALAGYPVTEEYLKRGLPDPNKLGNNYTMANMSTAPTVATSSTTGVACASSKLYTWYTVCLNDGGWTNLSPASPTWTATNSVCTGGGTPYACCTGSGTGGCTSRKVVLTRTASCPANSDGWGAVFTCTGSGCDGTTKFFVPASGTSGVSNLDQAVVSNSLSSNEFTCVTGTVLHDGTNTTGFKADMNFDVLGQGKIGFANRAGGVLNLITENARQLWMSSTGLMQSLDAGSTFQRLWSRFRIVTVGAQGSDYTDPVAAANANPSTCAAPIFFAIAGGAYTPNALIGSTMDCAVFAGSGVGTTTIGNTSGSNTLTINGNNWVNTTIRDMSIVGDSTHNPIGGSISGTVKLINVDLTSTGTTGTGEDCWNTRQATSGVAADLWFVNSQCSYVTDGMTFGSSSINDATHVHSYNNRFLHNTVTAPYSSRFSGWSLFNEVVSFESVGDSFWLDSTPNTGHACAGCGNNAYLFEHTGAGNPTPPAPYSIRGARIYINDKMANGTNAEATGIKVTVNATAVGAVDVIGSEIFVNMPNDSGNGTSQGIKVENATTVVRVLGGTKIRTTGGQAGTRKDLVGNVAGSIVVDSSIDWQTDNGNLTSSSNITGTGVSVASSATVTLPTIGDFFVITGNTNITSVTASWAGREVTLEFTGTPTFTDGSNLKLAGNLVATADDTIRIRCDGTNWFEVGRSVN